MNIVPGEVCVIVSPVLGWPHENQEDIVLGEFQKGTCCLIVHADETSQYVMVIGVDLVAYLDCSYLAECK